MHHVGSLQPTSGNSRSETSSVRLLELTLKSFTNAQQKRMGPRWFRRTRLTVKICMEVCAFLDVKLSIFVLLEIGKKDNRWLNMIDED